MGLLLGVLIGAWQGFWVAYVGIPAFIVTLSGMLIFRGANQFVGKSNTIPVPADFQYIGSGYLPEIGPNTGYNNLTVLLGLAAVAFVIFSEIRSRRNAKALGAEVPETWVMRRQAGPDLRRHPLRHLPLRHRPAGHVLPGPRA